VSNSLSSVLKLLSTWRLAKGLKVADEMAQMILEFRRRLWVNYWGEVGSQPVTNPPATWELAKDRRGGKGKW